MSQIIFDSFCVSLILSVSSAVVQESRSLGGTANLLEYEAIHVYILLTEVGTDLAGPLR